MAWDRKDDALFKTENQDNKENDTYLIKLLLPVVTTVLFYPRHDFTFPAWNDCCIQETPAHRNKMLTYNHSALFKYIYIPYVCLTVLNTL